MLAIRVNGAISILLLEEDLLQYSGMKMASNATKINATRYNN